MTRSDAEPVPNAARKSDRKAGPSIHVQRARKLLYGGVVGGVAATLICLLLFGVLYGGRGVASAAFAAGMTLFFYVIGQLVMVGFANAGARTLLVVSMTSYTTRVFALGVILLFYNRYQDNFSFLVPIVVFVTTIVVVAGWLAVEIIVFSRLRITAYDTEYVDPPNSSESVSDADDRA